MNKAELITKLSEDAGITKTQANDALDSFVEAVAKTLKGSGKVTLVGFGTFSVSKRSARNGRTPSGRFTPRAAADNGTRARDVREAVAASARRRRP